MISLATSYGWLYACAQTTLVGAEREKRAKVLLAQGEFLAAQTLADAAKVISTEPAALQLRYLQTLTEIAVERNSTIIFPLPIDLLSSFISALQRGSGEAAEAPPVQQAPPVIAAPVEPTLAVPMPPEPVVARSDGR